MVAQETQDQTPVVQQPPNPEQVPAPPVVQQPPNPAPKPAQQRRNSAGNSDDEEDENPTARSVAVGAMGVVAGLGCYAIGDHIRRRGDASDNDLDRVLHTLSEHAKRKVGSDFLKKFVAGCDANVKAFLLDGASQHSEGGAAASKLAGALQNMGDQEEGFAYIGDLTG